MWLTTAWSILNLSFNIFWHPWFFWNRVRFVILGYAFFFATRSIFVPLFLQSGPFLFHFFYNQVHFFVPFFWQPGPFLFRYNCNQVHFCSILFLKPGPFFVCSVIIATRSFFCFSYSVLFKTSVVSRKTPPSSTACDEIKWQTLTTHHVDDDALASSSSRIL